VVPFRPGQAETSPRVYELACPFGGSSKLFFSPPTATKRPRPGRLAGPPNPAASGDLARENRAFLTRVPVHLAVARQHVVSAMFIDIRPCRPADQAPTIPNETAPHVRLSGRAGVPAYGRQRSGRRPPTPAPFPCFSPGPARGSPCPSDLRAPETDRLVPRLAR